MAEAMISGASTMDERRRQLWLLRAACFFQIFSFGIQWSFAGVWMREQGLGETTIGLVWSTSIFLWFLTGLLWGRIADRTGRARDIVRAGCLLQAAAIGRLFLAMDELWRMDSG